MSLRVLPFAWTVIAFALFVGGSAAGCADRCETATDLIDAYKAATACVADGDCVAFAFVGDGCRSEYTPWVACGIVGLNSAAGETYATASNLTRLNRLTMERCAVTEVECAACLEPAGTRAHCANGRCAVEILDGCADDGQCPAGRVCCRSTGRCASTDACPDEAAENSGE